MAKFTKRQKLSKREETDLIIDFCNAVTSITSIEEATLFIQDLMSKSEIRMLAKRLKIARLLIENQTYYVISKKLKVGYSTIARVNFWLNQSGEGFRLIFNKNRDFKKIKKPHWSGIKRRYPMYYWPEILLKEIVYSANQRQKKKLINIIDTLDDKNETIKELNKILKQNYHTT